MGRIFEAIRPRRAGSNGGNDILANPTYMAADCSIPIYEQYENYVAPFDVKRAVERMLATVPDKYLTGLGSIVLTNEVALTGTRARRMTFSRGKKVSAANALGLYHPRWGSDPAWIELRVDRIFRNYPAKLLKFPVTREVQLGATFFHELGHHIHAEHRPEFKEKEDVADIWKQKGQGNFLRKRFWYLTPLFCVLRWVDRRCNLQGRIRERADRRAAAASSTKGQPQER